MTQEQKNVLIKDLCCRLPYGVKISVNDKVETLQGIDILDNVAEYGSFLSSDIQEVKPYLFPPSSMTEEQLKLFDGVILPNGHVVASNFGLDYLDSIHVDYRRLIPNGLAINATNLKIY